MNASRGIALVLGATVLWGTTGTAQSFASLTLSSFWIGTIRLVLAGLFLGVCSMALPRRHRRSPPSRTRRPARMPWRTVLAAAASMALYNLAFFAGVRASSVALGTAVALGSAPVWAGLLQAVLDRRLPPGIWWAGVGVATGGLAIALGGGAAMAEESLGLCLAAGLGYAVYARSTKDLVADRPLVPVTACVFALAGLMATPVALAVSGLPRVGSADMAVLGWLGIAGTGIAYLLFAAGIRGVSSATAVALAMAEPVTAALLAVLVVGERPTMGVIVGLLAVLGGLALLVRGEITLARSWRGDQ